MPLADDLLPFEAAGFPPARVLEEAEVPSAEACLDEDDGAGDEACLFFERLLGARDHDLLLAFPNGALGRKLAAPAASLAGGEQAGAPLLSCFAALSRAA